MPESLCYVVSSEIKNPLVDVRNYLLSTNCDIKEAITLLEFPDKINFFKISLNHLAKSKQIGDDIKKIVSRTCSHGTTPIFKLANLEFCFILRIDFK